MMILKKGYSDIISVLDYVKKLILHRLEISNKKMINVFWTGFFCIKMCLMT